ncbi:hypothetical protein [Nguyenibacter vanlangensis]|uniref:Uncharacterized protein n=1 Tax=Nguyenibacter vanlangensis TaxID=1216886 RepID=A0A7Y7ISP5_9PROT|nr:hypothetical protein [Nguyenibacter vanlangensis]NVN09644.1 hypothetical protein [Nguyenibacter vanlangensis]
MSYFIAKGATRALGHLDRDAGVVLVSPLDKLSEQAGRNEGVDAGAKAAALSRHRHTRRLSGVIKLAGARSDKLNGVAVWPFCPRRLDAESAFASATCAIGRAKRPAM